MSETYIVLVNDREDSKHGEISVLEGAEQAERLVETLLEAGFDPSRIRVFSGSANEFQISHRPVVALGADEDGAERKPAEARVAAAVSPVAEPAARQPAKEEPVEEAATADEPAEEEAVVAAQQTDNRVRFSSLFRSA